MCRRFRWVLWLGGFILIGNFAVLRLYGDTLQSTHLFIVRGTVFYPLAFLNLIVGIAVIALMILDLVRKRE